MSVYNYVQGVIDGMKIGDIITIDRPDKLKAFRKFLSEISAREHKKFTTKLKGNEFHILRVNYYSIAENLEAE